MLVHSSHRGSNSYVAELPLVLDAAYAFWIGVRGVVPLDWLFEVGSSQLRRALDEGCPLTLDFATPVLRAALLDELDEPEAA